MACWALSDRAADTESVWSIDTPLSYTRDMQAHTVTDRLCRVSTGPLSLTSVHPHTRACAHTHTHTHTSTVKSASTYQSCAFNTRTTCHGIPALSYLSCMAQHVFHTCLSFLWLQTFHPQETLESQVLLFIQLGIFAGKKPDYCTQNDMFCYLRIMLFLW